jgi:cysteinyl-tRNA synthetase
MATELLGETIDIHCGGVDNMFPHHENEIAQSEGCSGRRFVHHWFHVEHLLVDHKKMSKSLHNFYTLRDLLSRGYRGEEVRYLLLSTHYRGQLNFTMAGLDAARASLERIADAIHRLRSIEIEGRFSWVDAHLERASQRFRAALADDLNISIALAALFDLIRELNGLSDERKIGKGDVERIFALFHEWNQVLAVLPLDLPEEVIPQALLERLQQREEARRAKNFALSDKIRDELWREGFWIEDTPSGARLKRRDLSPRDA